MDTTKIRIIATGDARTPLRDELGRWEPGQYLGRDAKGEPKAQEVEETEQVRRAIGRGDLAVVPEVTELAELPPPVPADPPSADVAAPAPPPPTPTPATPVPQES